MNKFFAFIIVMICLTGCEIPRNDYETFYEFQVANITRTHDKTSYVYTGANNKFWIRLPMITKQQIYINDVIQVSEGFKDNKYFCAVSKLIDGEYKEIYNQDNKE